MRFATDTRPKIQKKYKNPDTFAKNIKQSQIGGPQGWLAGWLAECLASWLAGWMAGLESALGCLKAVSCKFELEFN